MTMLTHDTLGDFVARLQATARNRGRELCGRCAGSLTSPCRRCELRHERIAQRHADGYDPVQIAVAETLPAWRVEQILAHVCVGQEQAQRTQGALRDELGDSLVDLILAGPPSGRDARREYHHYRDLLLGAHGWTTRSVNLVLGGTHIPNRTLREQYLKKREIDGDALTSSAMAVTCGLIDDTHFARHIGLRPDSTTRKVQADGSVRVYGGATRAAIEIGLAERVAIAIGLHPTEIPGL